MTQEVHLSNRRLCVAGMSDFIGKDRVTEKWPIIQVLTLLAVEILSRESDIELVIDPTNISCNNECNFEGGFATKKLMDRQKWLSGKTSKIQLPIS